MKLKLVVIHLDLVIDSMELEPGEYSVGRASQNNIVVQHLSLPLEHGRIFFDEGAWFYQPNGASRVPILDDSVLPLSDQISLTTQAYLESGQTHLGIFSNLKKARKDVLQKRLWIVGGLVASLFLLSFLTYQNLKSGTRGHQQSQLISSVRDKIVEFEAHRDERPIEELKKYGGLTDADFKKNAGFCTGFLVGPDIVLTAAHCLFGRFVIDLNKDFYLKAADGKSFQVKEILGFDVKRDFLFLKTEGMAEYGHLNFAPDFEIEQKVYTVGNVHGEGIAIRDGILSSESSDPDEPDVKFLRYSAGTSPGNSGGPLLNEDGEVVALVFAATMSENFNLGTPARDLQAAYDRYVNAEAPQNIHLAMKRVLNFKPSIMLQSLAIPYLPQFDEYPEISQAFNEIAVDIQVPMDFEKVDQLVLAPINKAILETFGHVQEILLNKNEIILDWKSFVSEETPAILPSQFDLSQSVFVKKQGRYVPKVAGLIDSPSKADFIKYKEQLKKEKKFDFQSYGYNIEVSEEKFDLLPTDIFYKPKDSSGNKPRLQNLAFGTPYSQLLLIDKEDVRTDGFFGLKMFLKNFLGDTGVLVAASSRFIRPLSVKDFTIQNFDLENQDIKVESVKDGLGRQWTRSHIKLFEGTNIYTYCIELPEGSLCIGRVLNVYNDYLLGLIENNFRSYILSHLLINPYFWEKTALLSFLEQQKAQHIPLMAGVNGQLAGNQLQVQLDGFPVEFQVNDWESLESIRLQTGLLRKAEKAQWAGYGLQWVKRSAQKDEVCGAGVEVFESQSAFILNYLRDRKKQEKLRKIKGEEPKPLPGIWYKPFRGLSVPFQLFGYCAPLEEDPRVMGQFFVDFKKARPYKLGYSIK